MAVFMLQFPNYVPRCPSELTQLPLRLLNCFRETQWYSAQHQISLDTLQLNIIHTAFLLRTPCLCKSRFSAAAVITTKYLVNVKISIEQNLKIVALGLIPRSEKLCSSQKVYIANRKKLWLEWSENILFIF